MFYQNECYQNELKKILEVKLPYKNMNNKNILITGGNGLIGSYLVDTMVYLVENKNIELNIFVLCRNKEKAENRFRDHIGKVYFNLLIQDVCDDYKYDIKFDYIIHAASNAHPLAFAKNPVEVIEANVTGITKLLKYAIRKGNEKFLFVSSSEVYGENNSIEKYTESSFGKIETMSVRSCYPESKRMAETIGMAYREQYGVKFVSVRPGYVYGATFIEENSRANEQFIKCVVNKKNIILKSAGEQIRSYCYIADCISAILTVLLIGKSGEAYNIANKNQEISIKEFANILAKKWDVKLEFDIPKEVEKKGYAVIKDTLLAVDKIEKLGWEGKYNLDMSINNLFDILKSNK